MSIDLRPPDIEITRTKDGLTRSYGHVYWRPFIVHLLGRTVIGRKHLR